MSILYGRDRERHGLVRSSRLTPATGALEEKGASAAARQEEAWLPGRGGALGAQRTESLWALCSRVRRFWPGDPARRVVGVPS